MPTPLVGVIGKTNVGKSTFFAAATELSVEIENRPFVTIEPNIGIAYVRGKCPHVELGLPKCDPINSLCIKGWRFIPVKLMDVAGLIKGAHRGRGLGNKFLDDLRKADVLLHVVDMAGSTDEDGNPVKPGTHDPLEDILAIEDEVNEWFFQILWNGWDRFSRGLDTMPSDKAVEAIAKRLSGLSIRKEHVIEAIKLAGLEGRKPGSWGREGVREFTRRLREVAKPIVIVANKMDVPTAEDNYRRVREELKDRLIVPTSALSELILRRAAKSGYVDYVPGDPGFKILDPGRLSRKQAKALELIAEFMEKWGGTGVQQALNTAVFEVLKMIVVYPVEDANKLTDRNGRVLPDAHLLPEGSTALDLAAVVHTELAKGFLYAINVRVKRRVGASYVLKDGDIIKIVSATARH